MTEREISADLALETVARLRKRGGGLRLWQTGLTLPLTIVFTTLVAGGVATASITQALACAAAALACGAITVRNFRQNSFVDPWQARQMRRLPPPHSAVLAGNRLLVGTTASPRASWCAVALSDREVRELRTLALPAARVVDV